MVGLAASLGIGVHTRNGGHIVATETGVGHRVVNGEIVSRNSRQFIQVLLFISLVLLLVDAFYDDRSVIVVHLLVLRLSVLMNARWGLSKGSVGDRSMSNGNMGNGSVILGRFTMKRLFQS